MVTWVRAGEEHWLIQIGLLQSQDNGNICYIRCTILRHVTGRHLIFISRIVAKDHVSVVVTAAQILFLEHSQSNNNEISVCRKIAVVLLYIGIHKRLQRCTGSKYSGRNGNLVVKCTLAGWASLHTFPVMHVNWWDFRRHLKAIFTLFFTLYGHKHVIKSRIWDIFLTRVKNYGYVDNLA